MTGDPLWEWAQGVVRTPDVRAENAELLVGLRREQERRGVTPSSIHAREKRVRAFMAWMEPRSVLEASREDVEDWLDTRQLAAGTRAGYVSHLRAFFRWLVDEERLEVDPTARIRMPRRRRRLPRPTAEGDVARAIEASTGDVRCFVLLAAYQGLRCQEIAGLEGEDIDRRAGLLFVRNGKGEKDRVLPLHPLVAEALADKPTSGVLFRQPGTGQPCRSHNVSHRVRRLFQAQDIEGGAHRLRHAFATSFYRMTRDLRLTQELLGHASPATTAVYAGFDPEGARMVRDIAYQAATAS